MSLTAHRQDEPARGSNGKTREVVYPDGTTREVGVREEEAFVDAVCERVVEELGPRLGSAVEDAIDQRYRELRERVDERVEDAAPVAVGAEGAPAVVGRLPATRADVDRAVRDALDDARAAYEHAARNGGLLTEADYDCIADRVVERIDARAGELADEIENGDDAEHESDEDSARTRRTYRTPEDTPPVAELHWSERPIGSFLFGSGE
jgi:hypothetical protein